MILAAVTINAAFNSGIIDTAVNGAVNYADAQNKEEITFEDLDRDIQDIVNKIKDYDIGGDKEDTPLNHEPVVGDVTVARVANSTDKLTITATAEDLDGDSLTYTLLRGDTEDNIAEIELAPTSISGNTVTFTDTGLTMAKTYYYKVKASDGSESSISANYGSERTWCKAGHCEGGHYEYTKCPECERRKNYLFCMWTGHGFETNTCKKCDGVGFLCFNCKGKVYHDDGRWARTDTEFTCPLCGIRTNGEHERTMKCNDCGSSMLTRTYGCNHYDFSWRNEPRCTTCMRYIL